MKITIDRKRVFDKVRSEVFYRGEVRPDVSATVQMSTDDSDVFGDLFEEAAEKALGELLIWGYPSVAVAGDAVFELCPPVSWPIMTEELTRAIEVFMVHKIVNRWMLMLGVGSEDFQNEDSLNIRRVLNKREKPV